MRKALILIPASLLLAAGCSSGAKHAQTLSAASTPPAPASASVAPSTAVSLSSELLMVSDLPAGWSSTTPSSSSGGAESCKALNNGPWKTLPNHAEADFQQSAVGPFLVEELATGSSAQVSQAWTAFGTATSACRSFSATTASGTVQYSLQALSFPSYGDATYAFALSISQSGITASGDVIVVREGDALVQMLALSIGSGVPIATVEQATSAAVNRAK